MNVDVDQWACLDSVDGELQRAIANDEPHPEDVLADFGRTRNVRRGSVEWVSDETTRVQRMIND